MLFIHKNYMNDNKVYDSGSKIFVILQKLINFVKVEFLRQFDLSMMLTDFSTFDVGSCYRETKSN
jgi:hypothetical protein